MTPKVLAFLILSRNRRVLADLVPPILIALWSRWESPGLVLLSFTLQVILMILGNTRKNRKDIWIRTVLWSAYISADSVAGFAISVISRNLSDALIISAAFRGQVLHENADPETISRYLSGSIEIATFWAPFLLLHLGGQDVITAYALEDNELWLRHLLDLVVQTGLVSYILFKARTESRLLYLSIMMLVSGFIRYAERTWSLWSASNNQRRQVQIDHAEFEDNGDEVLLAVKMLRRTELMFTDLFPLLPGTGDSNSAKKVVHTRPWREVIDIVAIELELMYEKLYTKARLIHSPWGFPLRLISFLLTLSTLVLFSFELHKYTYPIAEIAVSFLLMVAAIVLDAYAAFVFLTSYRTIAWLREHPAAPVKLKSLLKLRTPSWSNSMGQFSVVRNFLIQKRVGRVSKLINRILNRYELLPYVRHKTIPDYLKEGILEFLKQVDRGKYGQPYSILKSRGRASWKIYAQQVTHLRQQPPPDSDMEFGQRIILWHLVTEVCYYLDHELLSSNNMLQDMFQRSNISKCISRYMMHLFVVSSDMLPPRGAKIEKRFYKGIYRSWQPLFVDHGRRRDRLPNLELEANRQDAQEKGRRSDSRVQACQRFWATTKDSRRRWKISTLQVAHDLLRTLRPDDTTKENLGLKWELLGGVWFELLTYAADQCSGNQHAQHLGQGGELLTHVWVLLGHLGLTDQPSLE